MSMDFLQVFLLSVLQGVTEFLPISSSAHLVLVPLITGWQDQGVAFDVALHVGTLAAVMAYFWKDVATLCRGKVDVFTFSFKTEDAQLVLNLFISTIPIIIFALLLKDFVAEGARSFVVLGATSVIFGVLLYVADHHPLKPSWVLGVLANVWPTFLWPTGYRTVTKNLMLAARAEVRGKEKENLSEIKWFSALFFGVFQAFAIIPGTSRSGACMTAGRFLGFSRKAASHYALLMSIPTIFIAGVLTLGTGLTTEGGLNWAENREAFVWGICLSFSVAFFTIHFLMKWINKIGFLPFVIYRLALGGALLGVSFL